MKTVCEMAGVGESVREASALTRYNPREFYCMSIKPHELAKYDRKMWPSLRVACPTCGVSPGSPCFRKSNDGVKIPLLQPHAKRVAATRDLP